MNTAALSIYVPDTSEELDTYKPYNPASETPDFAEGDRIWVKDIVPGCLVLGTLRGVAFQQRLHFAFDGWIMNFGAPVSATYPWSCGVVWAHQMLKPADNIKVLVKWSWGENGPKPDNVDLHAEAAKRLAGELGVESRDISVGLPSARRGSATQVLQEFYGGMTPETATVLIFGGAGPRSTQRYGG